MGMKEIHQESIQNTDAIVLHEFKLRYKNKAKIIYGFVEGIDDPCFYRGFLENSLSSDWRVELWPAGNKDSVYKIYSNFDWTRFNDEQILFFVDKDLSVVLGRQYTIAKNIYITDEYSIENSIVTPNICDRLLREICGFTTLKYDESDFILEHFKQQIEEFKKYLIPIMGCIVYWHQNKLLNRQSRLNNILMKHAFRVKNGKIEVIDSPNEKKDIIEYAHAQCNIDLINRENIIQSIEKFQATNCHEKFTRGKYLLWFLVEYCISLNRDWESLDFISIKQRPKMAVNLSQSNAIVQIAPRCRIPDSLKHFFNNTIFRYEKTISA
ncbi:MULTISPECIES: DUF4435 domain-containing protein [Bacteroides]|uniref:DUF4435 domain-containing protein n=3 Tax=Bacteroides TaxID=816 RepID=A0AAP9SU41_BACFG|nr:MULTISPECIES: DUF4435 domain-containing protein [Bacteroides]EFR54407.1 hypothetical protein BFAG_03105 [Bacteroides fragilis 3_1_12]MBM6512022.1 DUF4435 domain-containing protein [Bacteroides fragilis]MCM0384452.1 DUF4435 domain-containing protein [Bacteroides fragilis]MDV6163738.1 DUF4435 domain-containing protein [Bacteroides hominis (ex Liu et al. 2022)]OCL20330.1 hypothetical protein AOQ65_02590 [Bacteroides fragilis]